MRGARADAHLRSRSFFKPKASGGPQVMVGPKTLSYGPSCNGGSALRPYRPSLVIRKTPVSRPYHGLRRKTASLFFGLVPCNRCNHPVTDSAS